MKNIEYDIGFADSEVISYFRNQDGLTLNLKTWNEVILVFVFKDVIAVCEHDAGDIANVCEEDANNPFLADALKNLYEGAVDAEHGYHHYSFINDDDVAVLQVVARSMNIERTE